MSPRQAPEPIESVNLERLRIELTMLERRLKDGEMKVRQAKQSGDRTASERWERAWIGLLEQYEMTHDRIERATQGQSASLNDFSSD